MAIYLVANKRTYLHGGNTCTIVHSQSGGLKLTSAHSHRKYKFTKRVHTHCIWISCLIFLNYRFVLCSTLYFSFVIFLCIVKRQGRINSWHSHLLAFKGSLSRKGVVKMMLCNNTHKHKTPTHNFMSATMQIHTKIQCNTPFWPSEHINTTS